MKQELPKPVVITVVVVVVVLAVAFGLYQLNPPPRSIKEMGGGAPVQAGKGNLAPIGPDGKPIDESK